MTSDLSSDFTSLKVAIVHYWLVGMRGGERVLEDICALFPQADLFTHVADTENLSPALKQHQINQTFIGRLPGAKKHYQKYLPLMPHALEALDLSGYDLVISSEAGPAKGVITDPNALHICYCHSPMRYIWDQFHVYHTQAGRLTRFAMPWLAHRLRLWDFASAARPDVIVANSDFIRRRVAKSWGRDARVIHPSVDLAAFTPGDPNAVQDFYLSVGELVSYKRPDVLVDAFNQSGKALIIIGDGPERSALQSKAKSNIKFLGRASFEELQQHYQQARALIFPGIEDFGIIPLESMASGRPVVALGKGGAVETVRDGITGVLFKDCTPQSLNSAIQRLETELLPVLEPNSLKDHAAGFGKERFRFEFAQLVRDHL
ncbi:MAG: glycosyltransferase [Paracoccaceae bacterium]